ncbi:acyltransferase [Streptomyces sp. NPDC007861]|uniref:acyltransferase family protein n=1 Tax=Streptomyces sp. NPDC007861 TaxID=3154893 RepID=UPI0034081CC4
MTTGTTAAPSARHRAEPPEPGPAPGRDRYFDLLRAIALFRVVLYHLVGWAWLPLVFPSMGVMFALAGNLMARSLKRPAVQVVRGRMRRLLPPLWVLGAVGVTGMVLQGWGPDAEGHPGWWWTHLLFWIVPVSDPPYAAEGLTGVPGLLGGAWAEDLAGPLWYIRAYLWYVLLSPFLLRALRKAPLVTLVAPLALSAVLAAEVLSLPERIDSALTDFSTFGACWLLGMAHQEGILRRLPRYIVPSVAPVIMAGGLWWAVHEGFRTGFDLDSIPVAQALWSFGAVLLLLHLSPSWSAWPPRLRAWDSTVTLLNSRAVTVYLWSNVCILMAATLWDQLWDIGFLEDRFSWLLDSWVPVLVLAWALIAGCIVLFGWAEDLAARRRPRLWPNGDAPRAKRRSQQP